MEQKYAYDATVMDRADNWKPFCVCPDMKETTHLHPSTTAWEHAVFVCDWMNAYRKTVSPGKRLYFPASHRRNL